MNYKQVLDIALWFTVTAGAVAGALSAFDLSTPHGRGAAVAPVIAVLVAALKSPPDLAADATKPVAVPPAA